MALALTPWSRQIAGVRGSEIFRYALGGATGLVGVPASLIILFGMSIFCVREDRSPTRVKVLWFALFLVTAWFGATAYYFAVYRRRIRHANQQTVTGNSTLADGSAGSARNGGRLA